MERYITTLFAILLQKGIKNIEKAIPFSENGFLLNIIFSIRNLLPFQPFCSVFGLQ
jgi:hypothetical protein